MCIIATAFALSRSGNRDASAVYWLGQVGIVAAPVVLVALVNLRRWQGRAVALATGVASFAVMVDYQPLRFAFSDEYQHYETFHNIVASGHLFGANTALPVSPQFPALEIIASALRDTTHLSLFAAATLCDGVCHTLTLLLVFEIAFLVVQGARWATVATLVYTFNPQYQFIDSYFTYTVIALVFGFACVYCVLRYLRGKRPELRWLAAGFAAYCLCAVSHHLTSYLLVAFLAIAAVVVLVYKQWRSALGLTALCVAAGAVAGGWLVGVATAVPGYLATAIGGLVIIGHSQRVPTRHGLDVVLGSRPTSGTPATDLLLEYVGAGILVVWYTAALARLTIRPLRDWWRRDDRSRRRIGPVEVSMIVASVLLYVAIGLRLGVGGGSQASARLFAYLLLPVGCVIALGTRTKSSAVIAPPRPSTGRGMNVLLGAAAVLIWVGIVAASWPPSYARLPGPYLPGGWERSIDPATVAAATWASRHLPPHRYFISDEMTGAVFQGLGDETEVGSAAARVFLAPRMTPQVLSLLHHYDVSYIVVDLRLSEQLPADGEYFVDDPFAGRYRAPLPKADLTKFLDWPAGAVVYSNVEVDVIKTGFGS